MANEKIEIDLSGVQMEAPGFAAVWEAVKPTPAEALGAAAGNLAGGVAGYMVGKSLGAGFLGKAFFTLAGTGVGGALAAYVTSKLGKDTV